MRIPSGLAALLGSTIPLWVVLLEWFDPGGARPGARVLQGMAAGFVGVAVLVGPEIASGGGGDLVASAAVLLGSLSWSLGTVRTRSATLPKSRALSSGMQLLAGGALLVVASAATGELAELDLGAISPKSLLATGYLIVFGSVIAFSAFAWLVRVSTPTRVATYAYVNPIVAVGLGWLVGEPVGAHTLIAGGWIVLAVVAITSSPARAKRQPRSRSAIRRDAEAQRTSTAALSVRIVPRKGPTPDQLGTA